MAPRKPIVPSSKREPETAKGILQQGPELLAQIKEGYLFTASPPREFPTFVRSELELGRILGHGGFGIVREIRAIRHTEEGGHQHDHDDDNKEVSEETKERRRQFQRMASTVEDQNEKHYDVETAKQHMSTHAIRQPQSKARYAMKYLKSNEENESLPPLMQARGQVDLATETLFLSSLFHPNIVKMRGYMECSNPMQEAGYFLILDRLYGTLDDKIMRVWRAKYDAATGGGGGLFKRKKTKESKWALEDLLLTRLLVVFDLASAFRYLHKRKVVYRDIRPDNVGFDVRDDVKVFDFGLAKSLHPSLKSKESKDMYRLTAKTGSMPYMAPEVARGQPYNEKCDVFSYSFLVWEILAMAIALDANPSPTPQQYFTRIAVRGERPPIQRSDAWPVRTCAVLKDAWKANPHDRPDFARIAKLIQLDLRDITNDDSVTNRSTHMSMRSQHSLELEY